MLGHALKSDLDHGYYVFIIRLPCFPVSLGSELYQTIRVPQSKYFATCKVAR